MVTKFLKQLSRVKALQTQDRSDEIRSFHITVDGRPSLKFKIGGRPMTWSQALQWSERLGDGWRLPNVHELREICRSPELLTALSDAALKVIQDAHHDEPTKLTSIFFWSGSDLPPLGDYAATLCLGHISVGQTHILNHLHVFCVKKV